MRGLQRSLRRLTTLAYETVKATPTTSSSTDVSPRRGLIIHGLLGSGRNWKTLSKNLAAKAADGSRREWELMLVDLRNHGASAALNGLSPPHDLEAAARDLLHLNAKSDSDWPMFVAGHSMGGKVALEYLRLLRQEPDAERKLPKEVWILDAQLGRVSPELEANREVDKIIHTVQSLPLPIPSRKWLYAKVRSELGMSLSVAHWLGSNLVGHPQGPMRWLFNVQGAAEMYQSYKMRSCWEVVLDPPKETTIHIVRGDRSERWNPQLINELHELRSQERTRVHVLENAGHWLHADNPEGLLKLVVPSLIQMQ